MTHWIKLCFLIICVLLIYVSSQETVNKNVVLLEHKDFLTYTHSITKRNINRCVGNSCVSCKNGSCQTSCTGASCSSCPNGNCCNSQNCNICAGNNCCSSSVCNSCANTCQAGCNNLQCQNTCVERCQTLPESCNNCMQPSCCNINDNCFKTCQQQCTTDDCYQTCIKNCIPVPMPAPMTACNVTHESRPCPNTSVVIDNVLKEYKPVNITTIINLRNYINNTNIVNNPINVTSHNINHIHVTRDKTKDNLIEIIRNTTLVQQPIIINNTKCEEKNCSQRRCCYVVHPVHCYDIPEPPYRKCIQRRHRECSDICSSVVVHIVNVPKPYPFPMPYPGFRPRCRYTQQYPWVQCGHYGVQDCGSCYTCGGAYNPRYCRVQNTCQTLCRGGIFYRTPDNNFQRFIQKNSPTYTSCGSTCPGGQIASYPQHTLQAPPPIGPVPIQPQQPIQPEYIQQAPNIEYNQPQYIHTQQIETEPQRTFILRPPATANVAPPQEVFQQPSQVQPMYIPQGGGCPQPGGCPQQQLQQMYIPQTGGCPQPGGCPHQPIPYPGPVFEQVHGVPQIRN